MTTPDHGQFNRDSETVVEAITQDQVLIAHTVAAVDLYLEALGHSLDPGLIEELGLLKQKLEMWGRGETSLQIKSNKRKSIPGRSTVTLTVNLSSEDGDLPTDSSGPQNQLSLHINTTRPSGAQVGAVPPDAAITVSTVDVYRDSHTHKPTFIPRAGIRYDQLREGSRSSLFTPNGASLKVISISRTISHPVSNKDFGVMFRRIWGFASRTTR